MIDFVPPAFAQTLLALQAVGQSDFVSPFWNRYVQVLVAGSILFCIIILVSQLRAKVNKPGQEDLQPHAWDDDLQEYNNPMPRWWVGLFVITIIFGLFYLWAYPGFGTYQGAFAKLDAKYPNGWSQQRQYENEVAALDATSKPLFDKYYTMAIPDLAKDKEAMKIGERLFLNNCAQCHGADARGGKGYPNLTDSDWLYGGHPGAIEATILGGRNGVMPEQASTLLKQSATGVTDVANYVLSLSGSVHDRVSASRGKELFVACAACHTAAGTGSLSDTTGAGALTGAPNLTDKTWLYGGDIKTISETLAKGRNNTMPSWECFLGRERVHVVAAYVWHLNGREDDTFKNPVAPADYLAASAANMQAAIDAKRGEMQAQGKNQCAAANEVTVPKKP